MPDRHVMTATRMRWAHAWGDWRFHHGRCPICRAAALDQPNPSELCARGAALHEQLVAAHAAYQDSVAKPSGWRY